MRICQPLQCVGRQHVPHRQVLCLANVQAVRQGRARSSNSCRCSVSKDRDHLPVVDDAEVIVLPPPRTGSQYAWKDSWRGSSFSSGSGGGGRGGQNRARTRDWGSGPSSGLLFVLMYRIRMLLLYGVWVTVLYGALHAITDLLKCVAKLAAGGAAQAAHWAAGNLDSNSNSKQQPMWSYEPVPAAAEGSAAITAAAAVDAGSGASGLGIAGETAAAAASGQNVDSDAAGSSSNHETAATAQEESFASKFARAQDRPSAQPFTGLMSVIVPMYFMLMGSIVFFASM